MVTNRMFLASGRSTPFQPTRNATRDQATVTRSGPRPAGLAPQLDRAIAQHAVGLLQSDAFNVVMTELLDSARARFESSPFGPDGDNVRAIAHAQIVACKTIYEKLQAMADDAKIHDRIEADEAEHD